MHRRKIVIVGGGGLVGAATAQALAVKELTGSILLIDVAKDKAHGQAMDINHGAAFTSGVQVRSGSYEDIETDDIIVITCGASVQAGQTRLDLLATNARIVEEVVESIMARGKQVFLLLVTNPVDVLTYVAYKKSGLPRERVFGTGTALDTARLRVTLAADLGVSQQDVSAYILGEHGDSSFPALSSATIGGVPLEQFPGFKPSMIATIDADIRSAAQDIRAAKQSTYFGIAHTVVGIVDAMLRDVPTILAVSAVAEGEYGFSDLAIGLPALVSAHGARILENYPLNSHEKRQLGASGNVVQAALQRVAS